MRKWGTYIIWAVLTALLASCDSHSFKLSADLEGLENGNVRVVYLGDSGLVDNWVAARDGRLRVKGHSRERTLLALLDKDGRQLALLAVADGEKVTVKGHMEKPDEWSVGGSDLHKRWCAFKKDHAVLYSQGGERLNAAIEEYAGTHADDALSAVLLMCDYTHLPDNLPRVRKLVEALGGKARVGRLLESFQQMAAYTSRANVRLSSILLYNRAKKDFVPLELHEKVTFLYLWTNRQDDRSRQVRQLRSLWQKHEGRLQIADIDIEADTAMWQSTLIADSTHWQHYWAPGGPEDVALKSLNITTTPLYIVTDSVGNQVYRGNDATAACQAADKLL